MNVAFERLREWEAALGDLKKRLWETDREKVMEKMKPLMLYTGIAVAISSFGLVTFMLTVKSSKEMSSIHQLWLSTGKFLVTYVCMYRALDW